MITVLSVVIVVLACLLTCSLWVALHFFRGKRDSDSRRQGALTKLGQVSEQWVPLSEDYPWDPSNFRFLGAPIDGVQFEDDEIVFVEFKTGSSKLTGRQRKIQELASSGRVSFRVFRR